MQASEDNSITVVESHTEPYSNTNQNEKSLGTQYIYTTEGQLIPASGDHNVDINAQHFNTHIQQIDYQYDQQNPDGTVQQIVPGLIQDQSNTYIIDQTTYAQTSQEDTSTEQQELVASEPQTNQDHIATTEGEPYVVEQHVASENTEQISEIGQEDTSNNDATDSSHDLVIEEKQELVEEGGENQEAEEVPVNLNNLKSNPAIEIETEESLEAIEEDLQETVVEGETTIKEVDVEESEEPLVISEEANKDSYDQGESTRETSVNTDKKPKPRGRKPRTDIPLHILGHDVNNPMDNVINGKTPKPRPGVKVPYRNLISQIVSKAEIEKEIVERGRKKQEERQEIQFSRKLTSRLASKIATDPGEKPSRNAKNSLEVDTNGNQETVQNQDTSDNDNTDLLAILEGDGDTEEEIPEFSGTPNKGSSTTPTDETNLKNLEREIALQQLHDLPNLEPKTKYIKGHKFKEPPIPKGSPINLSYKSPVKTNLLKMEIEPQIKVNMTLKTYSRKRKSSEAIVESTPSPKKTNINNTAEIDVKPPIQSTVDSTYITKSSRVIKKKVIWDPDETPTKIKPSPIKTETKPSPVKAENVEKKPAHPKNEYKSADFAKKSADVKVKQEKKVADKQSLKKTPTSEKKHSPGAKGKQKKSKSEVDRLLGDEGAIKMLYELKNSDISVEEKRKKNVFSVEKTFKDLRKKANQIKSDLVNTTETTKSLRKKEGISPQKSAPGGISRQKSKDSSRSTPPPSPAFSYPNETSYLIRRRSSDSISSRDDTGESLEFDDTEERLLKKKPVCTEKDPLEIKKSKKTHESTKSQQLVENRIGHYKNLNVKKISKTITISLYTTDNNQGNYFTSELLSELTTALNKISIEKDCNVVLLQSSDPAIFSNGLDYKEIIFDKDQASELAGEVQDFLQCLLDFPKILVAGIQGECVGLAVTMLPLFDIVIASDDARFSLPYSKFGSMAEGGFLLAVPYMSNNGLVGDLLYASQKLTADEVHRRGLISKLCWPEKYQDTVKTTLMAIAQGSKQGLVINKQQLRAAIKADCEEAINSMGEELVQHWMSKECQNHFSKID